MPPPSKIAEKEAGSGTFDINVPTAGASTNAPPFPPSITEPTPTM
jgi:hypothetical protein